MLDLDGPVPVFAQLYRQVTSAVLQGRILEGTILPSARRLAADLGIHYHTVNKVYGLLRRDGFAVMDHRRRLTVHLPRAPGETYLNDWTEQQRTLLTEALRHGVAPGTMLRRFEALLGLAPRAGARRSVRAE